MLQYSIGGLSANTILLNNSQTVNNSITVSENTTADLLKATAANKVNNTTVNNTTSKFIAYPLNCPKWDDYKNDYPSPITNFWNYWKALEKFVVSYNDVDDKNIQMSKANYDNNTGYFSGNPISGDIDYRYMPTSELNKAYSSASLAKSRISIPNSLSTSLQADYTIAAVVLGAAAGICGIITTIVGVVTASTAGTFSPVLIVCLVITGAIVATTIAIGTCTGVVASSSSGINVESGKIDNRLIIMNAELTYRSTMPINCSTLTAAKMVFINKTNETGNNSINQTLNNTSNLNTTFNKSLNNINSINMLKNTTGPKGVPSNKTNSTNTTKSCNVIGVNDVPPSTQPIPEEVASSRSGTYLDEIYDIDMSGFPQEPAKPHPKWYQFWQWAEYGFNYAVWCGEAMGWAINHYDSMNKIASLCKHIQSDSQSLPG
jgi:hypothetical protein